MIIRKIKEDDIEEVLKIIVRNFDEIMTNYHSKDIIEKFKSHCTIDNLKHQMSWKVILVVEDNNHIVATGAVANFGTDEQPKYSISNFFVKPELHRQGIGTLLFDELRKIAIDKNVKMFHVPSSKNAISFYSSVGFSIDEDQPDLDDEITWMSMNLK